MAEKTISLLGVNHKTTPLAIREKMALTTGYEEPLRALGKIPACHELYLLSTCNRVEVLYVSEHGADPLEAVAQFLFGGTISVEEREQYLYRYHDTDAVKHLFEVAASLDSMVVGESQILGQIKEAYRYATEVGTTGPILNRLLHKAFSVAKRVRSETGIGSSAVSISYAAVQLAKKIFGELNEKQVLLIGAGEMAELAAEHLVGQGVGGVVVANRTLSRAVDLAKRFNGTSCVLEEVLSQLEAVDIIISSTGSSELLIRSEDVKPLMRARKNRPLFFIDIAVPRDLDPELNKIDDVFLYDIDDLSQVVEMNKAEREKEAVKAKRIVEEESLKFARWQQNLTITPTITAMRRKAEDICQQELEKTLSRLSVDEQDRQKIEKMAQAIAAKLLHDPMVYLKTESCKNNDDAKVDMIRSIYGLGNEDSGGN
ncbi:MAG: glutamyl-tRNA reductase [Desulfobulbaceae bacterium]|nr:MAG: glutamyl-tRNA reductase [Desulfobulbaceae bacterium]